MGGREMRKFVKAPGLDGGGDVYRNICLLMRKVFMPFLPCHVCMMTSHWAMFIQKLGMLF